MSVKTTALIFSGLIAFAFAVAWVLRPGSVAGPAAPPPVVERTRAEGWGCAVLAPVV